MEVAEKLKIDGIIGTNKEDFVNENRLMGDNDESSEEAKLVQKDSKVYTKKNTPRFKEEVALTFDNATREEAKRVVDELVYREGDLWFCKSCNKSAKQSSQIRKHAEVHIEGLALPCPLCGDSFRSRQRLADHKRRQH